MLQTNELLDIKEASIWATEYLGKTVTPSNIEIDAKDDRDALFNSEFFVGGEKDLSNEKERAERGFRINEIGEVDRHFAKFKN